MTVVTRDLLPAVDARVVFRIEVFKSKRANRRDLRDVLAGFRPVEVPRVAGKNDHAAGRKRLKLRQRSKRSPKPT